MIKNRKQIVILISFLFTASLMLVALPNVTTVNQNQNLNVNNNQTQLILPSASLISNSDISYNTPIARVLGTMAVQVNLTSYGLTSETVNITIHLNNATNLTYPMSLLNPKIPYSHVWIYKYVPGPTAPLGVQNFTIREYSTSLNINSSTFNFTIENSLPRIGIHFSNSVIYRNSTFSFDVTPSDAENSLAQLTWSTQIVRASDGAVMATYPKPDVSNLNYTTHITSQLGTYNIIANVTDLDGNTTTNEASFTIEDNPPVITGETVSISANETGGQPTNPDLHQILRVSGLMNVAVNVTDVEFTKDNSVLATSLTASDDHNNTLDLSGFSVTPVTGSNYKTFSFTNIKIPASAPAGNWNLNILAYKSNDTSCNSSFVYSFVVVNNIPNASLIQYTINNSTSQSQGLNFQVFQNLDFNINVTGVDPEGIQTVKLDIMDQNDQWYNFTFSNINDNFINFTLNAGVLAPGQYLVYVYAVDGDGVQVHSNVMSFVVLPDTFSSFLPWLMLIFGVIVGAGISIVVLGTRYRSLRKDYVDLVSGADYREILERNEKSKQKTAQEITNKEETSKEEPQEDKGKKKKRKMIRKL